MMSKPVAPSTPNTNETQGNNKTLMILGGLAVLSVGGFVAYKLLTKEEKKEVVRAVQTPGEKVQVVVERTPQYESTSIVNPTPDSAETTRDSPTYNKNSATTDYTTWRSYAEPRLGLKFKYPTHFEIKTTHPNSDTTLIEINSPSTKTRDDVQVYIMSEDQPHHINIREYMYMCLEPVQNFVGKFDKQLDREVQVNQVPGYEIEYTASKGTKSVRMWSVGVSVGTKTFVFQLTAPTTDQTINFDEIRNIVKSFEFIQVPYKGVSRVRTISGLEIDLPNIGFLVQPTNDTSTLLHAVSHTSHRVQTSIIIKKQSPTVFDTYISDLEISTPQARRVSTSLTILGTPVIAHRYTSILNDTNMDHILLCFKHDNIAYIVEATNQSNSYDDFERQLFKSLSSISFHTNTLRYDTIKYTNREEKFSIENPAMNTIVKEHSFQTIASFMVIPQNGLDNQNVLLMETAISAVDLNLPKDQNEALSRIAAAVKNNLEEAAYQHDYVINEESQVQIGNQRAVRFIYTQTEPLSQAIMKFFLTCFATDKGYVSVKSYTLGQVYTLETQKTFETIHNSFQFL